MVSLMVSSTWVCWLCVAAGCVDFYTSIWYPLRMFDIDTNEIKQLEAGLKLFNKRALPYAARDMVNKTAFYARGKYIDNQDDEMTIRTGWNKRNTMVDMARQRQLGDMEARTGNKLEYMAEQEEGFTRVSEGQHGTPIPTTYAGGAYKAAIRTKPVRKANRLANIKLKSKFKTAGANDMQRRVRVVQEAVKTGSRYVFMRSWSGNQYGIYKVIGGRKSMQGWPKGAKVRLVHDLSKKSTRTAGKPMMENAGNDARRKMGVFYARALEYQLKRSGIKW